MTQEYKRDPNETKLPKLLRRIIENPAGTVVVSSLLLLLYQACLPKGLTLDPAARTILWKIIPSETFHVSRFDIIGNILPYWIFANLLFVYAWRAARSAERMLLITFFGTIGTAMAVEGIEYFNLYRGTAAWDILSGAIGAFSGLFTGTAYVKLIHPRIKRFIIKNIRRSPWLIAACVLMLAICWDAARPFYIISDFGYLKNNIKHSVIIPFEPPGRDIREQLVLTEVRTPVTSRTPDYWGAVAERFIAYSLLLGLLVYRRKPSAIFGGLGLWGGLLVAVEMISLVTVNGTFNITHLSVGSAALPAALFGASAFSRRPKAGLHGLLALSVAYIQISDLRPFQFCPMAPITSRMFIPLLHHGNPSM